MRRKRTRRCLVAQARTRTAPACTKRSPARDAIATVPKSASAWIRAPSAPSTTSKPAGLQIVRAIAASDPSARRSADDPHRASRGTPIQDLPGGNSLRRRCHSCGFLRRVHLLLAVKALGAHGAGLPWAGTGAPDRREAGLVFGLLADAPGSYLPGVDVRGPGGWRGRQDLHLRTRLSVVRAFFGRSRFRILPGVADGLAVPFGLRPRPVQRGHYGGHLPAVRDALPPRLRPDLRVAGSHARRGT